MTLNDPVGVGSGDCCEKKDRQTSLRGLHINTFIQILVFTLLTGLQITLIKGKLDLLCSLLVYLTVQDGLWMLNLAWSPGLREACGFHLLTCSHSFAFRRNSGGTGYFRSKERKFDSKFLLVFNYWIIWGFPCHCKLILPGIPHPPGFLHLVLLVCGTGMSVSQCFPRASGSALRKRSNCNILQVLLFFIFPFPSHWTCCA